MIINFNEINKLIGSDWEYQINDCWAIVRKASKSAFGVCLPLVTIPEYSDLKANQSLFAVHAKRSWTQIDKPKAGCAALFYDKRGAPVHVGIYVESGNVLHCDGSTKRPGKTSYDKIKDILGIKYKTVEFYEYNNNS